MGWAGCGFSIVQPVHLPPAYRLECTVAVRLMMGFGCRCLSETGAVVRSFEWALGFCSIVHEVEWDWKGAVLTSCVGATVSIRNEEALVARARRHMMDHIAQLTLEPPSRMPTQLQYELCSTSGL